MEDSLNEPGLGPEQELFAKERGGGEEGGERKRKHLCPSSQVSALRKCAKDLLTHE